MFEDYESLSNQINVQLEELEKDIEAGTGNKKALAALEKESIIAEQCLVLFFEEYGEGEMKFEDFKENIKRILIINGRIEEDQEDEVVEEEEEAINEP